MTTLTTAQRIDRLAARLDHLRPWRDRAHVDLDAWTFDGDPLPFGTPWPALDGVRRLAHGEARVPDAWPLEEALLELEIGGEALLTVRFEPGGDRDDDRDAERFGVDPYHMRFPLRSRRFALEAEAVARLPFGVPNPGARLVRARLVWDDVALSELYRLLDLVRESAAALGDHEVVDPLLTAAERALTRVDLPSRTPDALARAAQRGAFDALWRAPGGLAAHPAALDDATRAAVRAATDTLRAELRALQERYPPVGSLLLSGHAHIDLAWLWPIDETRRKVRRSYASMIALMHRDERFTFNQSQAQALAWLADDDPALLEAIVAAAEDGRWEPIGGMWVESDTLMPTGESLSRQLLYGQRAFEHRFGRMPRVGWLPDCFGFAPALPQLLRLAGIDAFGTTKVNWNETNRFPHDLFWWEGLDGSRVLTHAFDNPRDNYNGLFEADTLVQVWRRYRGKHRHPESLLTLGYGDGGGGTTGEMLERQRAAADLPVLPRTHWGRIDAFFDAARASAEREALPVWLGEIYLELHRGTLTSQGRTKRLHRRAERALIGAEAIGSLAALHGAALPASLEAPWRSLLLNQFHDILPGSSIAEVYEQAERDLADVVAAGERARDAGLAALADALPHGDETTLLVVNAELGERPLRLALDAVDAASLEGAQAVEGGAVFASDLRVPGLAAIALRAAAAVEPARSPARATPTRLENAFLRVDVAEDGSLASVVDLRADREVLAGPGNQLWVHPDHPRAWDAWDVDVDYRDQGEAVREVVEREVVEDGPHRAALRVTRRYRDSLIRQTYRLWSNGARLDIVTHIVWRERQRLLKARFPLAVRAESAVFETAFGVVRRPTHANTSWDAARFEVAAHRFADLSEPGYGVALLNDGRYGHHTLPNELGITLLRSPMHPDPLADEGEHAFTYALYPHLGDWHEGGVLSEAEDLNQPLVARPTSVVPGVYRPLALEGTRLALGALKPAESGDALVLRVYEPSGARGTCRVTPPTGWRIGGALDLLERPLEPADPRAADGITPFQVRTWRLERV